MKVSRNVLLVLAIVGAVFLVSMLNSLPASVAIRQIDKRVPVTQRAVHLKMATGTVWAGRGWLTFEGQGGELAWRAAPLGLLRGALPVSLELVAPDLQVQAELALSVGGDAQLRSGAGRIGLQRLEPLLQRHAIRISGDVVMTQATALVGLRQGWPSVVDARFEWAGGEVAFPLAGNQRTAQLPPLKGALTLQDEELVMLVDLASSGSNLLEIRLQRDLVARINVRRRLLDELGLPWSQQSDADTVVFRVQQRLTR